MNFLFIIHRPEPHCKKLSGPCRSDRFIFFIVVGFLYLEKGCGEQMMASVETYLRRQQRHLRQWAQVPEVSTGLQHILFGAGSFFLSAAHLGGVSQPLAMGLCCAATGWQAVTAGAASVLGYRLFWGDAGLQGIVWSLTGSALALLLRRQQMIREMPLLIPALAALFVSVTGLTFQVLWLDETPFSLSVLRVLVAGGSAWLFERQTLHKDNFSQWFCAGVLTLALARASPLPWLNLGVLTCGFLSGRQSLAAAVLAGVGLDLTFTVPLPMTAVAGLCFFTRWLPTDNRILRWCSVGGIYIGVCLLQGMWDMHLLPGFLMGNVLGSLFPTVAAPESRKTPTGRAQVQLELTAGVLAESQQLLLETPASGIDEAALLEKAIHRSCSNCVLRNDCREKNNLTVYHLHHPLDFACRKPGRILGELRRGREQMLALRREKERLQEYRIALIQQYQFLCEYVQSVCDGLQKGETSLKPRYRIQISARSQGKSHVTGDTCMAFPGTRCRYFVVLCDGMGSGMGAAQQGRSTALLLKKMLTAGLSPEQALRSINSILALRGQAGMVTLDLAEVCLHSGKTAIYKWGAAPSWLLTEEELERIGYATAPPGISIAEAQETTQRLTLRPGASLILLSDGADIQQAILRRKLHCDMPPGELADTILRFSRIRSDDDATAAVLRLEWLQEKSVTQ